MARQERPLVVSAQCSGSDLERDKFCGALRKDAFIRQENLYKHFLIKSYAAFISIRVGCV